MTSDSVDIDRKYLTALKCYGTHCPVYKRLILKVASRLTIIIHEEKFGFFTQYLTNC